MKQLKELVDQFRYNLKDYKSWNFNETNTRQQFIDKFFELLWRDVNNKFWYSEQYKEVVLEDRLKIDWQTKAPDYSFRLGGRRIFFVEAKKPSVNIKDEVEPAYQIRRYSRTAKLPIGILTDFEELAIYDTRIKPNPKDKAWFARIAYFTFEEFEENREWIYNTLSKDAVQKWALDKYIQESKKKWTQSVDTDFLNMIDDRRDALAKNIYLRYEQVKQRNWDLDRLNNIVGDIVDKIIFLRIAEDKKIENLWNLENIANWKEIWKNLISYFEKSDKKYNSWLFDNTEIFKKFELDDKILKQILLSLYYPTCPYEFSVLGVDILGNIYEKFLGKTIVKEWRTIKTEFKPDVKKAGWVFYTPQYIVDYIVKNTVWELLKDKTPKQALELNIVDPACGSGAFLIGAYDYILNRFLTEHTKNNEVIKKSIKEAKIYQFKNSFHLSFNYKKEILKNMIYGVDIDRQAVAVSRLSLLLKLLEWETAETANQLFSTIDAALLPKLDDNIKCGNSLVDSSIYTNLDSPDEETIKKINAFDWEKEFVEVFDKWGFDAVIGNPPYIQLQKMQQEQPRFEQMNFETFAKTWDIYWLFYEKWNKLLKNWWTLGFITSNKRMRTGYGELLRKYLSENTNVLQLLDFWGFKVFKDATVDVNVLISEKWKNKNKWKACIISKDFNELTDLNTYFKKNKIDLKWLSQEIWTILDPIQQSIKNKVESIWTPLKNWDVKINYGIKTWYNEAFIIDEAKKNELIAQDPKSSEIIKPILRWRDIKRYDYNFAKLYLINTHNWYKNKNWDKVEKIKIEDYPIIKKHLDWFGEKLKNRSDKWETYYNLRNCAYIEEFEKEKIIYWEIVQGASFYFDKDNYYSEATWFLITWNSLKYLVAILNSKFWEYVFRTFYAWWWLWGSWIRYKKAFLENLPILKISESEQQAIIELVDQMLLAQKRLKGVEFEDDKKVIEKQIEIIDGKIDNLVFDLYWLNEEERKLVEESMK